MLRPGRYCVATKLISKAMSLELRFLMFNASNCFNSRSRITQGWIQVSKRQLSNILGFLTWDSIISIVLSLVIPCSRNLGKAFDLTKTLCVFFEMWIVWMSQNGDEGPKNPFVSYQIQGLLVKMFRPAPAVILILPRYWIGLLTHLQHDNPKAQQSLAIPQLPNFLGPSVGYQLHPRHRDDVAQLRSCGENEDDQLAKVYFRSQESLVHVSQHPGTSWVTNRWQTGMISRKKKKTVMCLISMISSIEVECIDLEGCPKRLHAGHLKVIACPASADLLWICRFLLIKNHESWIP